MRSSCHSLRRGVDLICQFKLNLPVQAGFAYLIVNLILRLLLEPLSKRRLWLKLFYRSLPRSPLISLLYVSLALSSLSLSSNSFSCLTLLTLSSPTYHFRQSEWVVARGQGEARHVGVVTKARDRGTRGQSVWGSRGDKLHSISQCLNMASTTSQ